jgi:hypothetical protein
MSKRGAILFVGVMVCGTACVMDTADDDPSNLDKVCAIPIVLQGATHDGPVRVTGIANCNTGNVTLDGETIGKVELFPGDVLEATDDPSRPRPIRTFGTVTPPLNVGLGCVGGVAPTNVTFQPAGDNIGGAGSYGSVVIPSACGANRAVQLGGGGDSNDAPDEHTD